MNLGKSVLLAVSLLTAAHSAQAIITVTWNSYSANGYDVTVTGSSLTPPFGNGGFKGTVGSPDGLWQVSVNAEYYPVEDQPGYLALQNGVQVQYTQVLKGFVFPTQVIPGTAQIFPAVLPISSLRFFQPAPVWTGGAQIEITSIPDINVPKDWTFTGHYFGTVPEPGSAALILTAALIFAARPFRGLRKQNPVV